MNRYELPPTTFAKPLPVTKITRQSLSTATTEPTRKKSLKRKRSSKPDTSDDTPKAFARLMAFSQGLKSHSGLDDGIVRSKKQKRAAEQSNASVQAPADTKSDGIPKINPGERLADYSVRVDAALPVSKLIGKGRKRGNDLLGIKTPQTKLEKKMQKMQKDWRNVEAKRKEALMEQAEEAEDEHRETNGMVGSFNSKRVGKKRKQGIDDDDPWAAVGHVQDPKPSKGLVGLHDVVQAPPQFTKALRGKFKVKDGAMINVLNVPTSAGSLKRREELGQSRKLVVEGYRRLMRERKGN